MANRASLANVGADAEAARALKNRDETIQCFSKNLEESSRQSYESEEKKQIKRETLAELMKDRVTDRHARHRKGNDIDFRVPETARQNTDTSRDPAAMSGMVPETLTTVRGMSDRDKFTIRPPYSDSCGGKELFTGSSGSGVRSYHGRSISPTSAPTLWKQ
jgi:hypothetical protein